MDYNLGTAHGTVKIDVDADGVTKAKEELGGVEEQAKKTSQSTDKAGASADKAAKRFNVVAATLTVMATKMALATAAGVGLIGIAIQLSGVVGLLPAVGVAGGLALGTLAVGMKGFGDAMKNAGDPEAFAESLKSLSPAARESAKALADWREDWIDVQQSVQNNLFQGMSDQIQRVAGAYLPMLDSAMNATATNMNSSLHGVIDLFMETGRQADMKAILDSSAASVGNLFNLLRPMASIFIDLAAVAAPKIQMLTLNLANAAEKAALFISNARQTGQLSAWMETGIQAVRDLWTILELLGGTVVNLIAALGGPDSLMGVLTLVATVLHTVSQYIRENIAWLGPLAAAIGGVVLAYKLWQAASATWAAAVAAHKLLVESGFLRLMGRIIVFAATWAVKFVVMAAQAAVWAAQMAIHVARVIAQWALLAAQSALHAARVAAAWLLTTGTAAATAIAQMIATVARYIAQWVLLAAQSAMHAARVAAAWLLTTGAAAATAIAQMVVIAARFVAQWVLMAAGAMARAAMMAAAWLVAMGPVGWVIATVIALVALIIANWDTVKAKTIEIWNAVVAWLKSAWESIKSAASSAWEAIKSAISTAVEAVRSTITSIINAVVSFLTSAWNNVRNAATSAWNAITSAISSAVNAVSNVIRSVIQAVVSFLTGAWNTARSAAQSAWNGIVSAVSSAVNSVMSFISSLPGRIQGVFSAAGSWLVSAGRNIVQGLWNGVQSMAGWITSKISSWASGLMNAALGALGINSPSIYMVEAGEYLMKGLAVGIDDDAKKAIDSAVGAAERVVGSVGMTIGGPDAFWDGTALGGARVPASAEVASHSAAQGDGTAAPTYHFNTYNPVAERASDSEARRLRALSALGAF